MSEEPAGSSRPLKIAFTLLAAIAVAVLFWVTARGLRRWLPPDYSVHGPAIDRIFLFIFWLSFVVMVAVEGMLLWFLIRYRGRAETAKGRFIHGNTRLEMIWTLIPAVIFLGLALWSKKVWEDYRYATLSRDPNRVKVLVVGEQFKWNVVYPGPDGKLGRYLAYPKTTDLVWPKLPPGISYTFPDVPGPAYLPEDKARVAINAYIGQVNPLGKDFDDPDGKDDLWQGALSRPLEIPKGRPIEIQLGSKDVIHDLFLPNFRVKLDAVPGMRGVVYFQANTSTAELENASRRQYTLDELAAGLEQNKSFTVAIGPDTPGANHKVDRRHHVDYWRYADKSGDTIVRDQSPLDAAAVSALRTAGITQVQAYQPQYLELVCEQLCGSGHYTMEDRVIVLENSEFQKKYETAATAVGQDATTVARR